MRVCLVSLCLCLARQYTRTSIWHSTQRHRDRTDSDQLSIAIGLLAILIGNDRCISRYIYVAMRLLQKRGSSTHVCVYLRVWCVCFSTCHCSGKAAVRSQISSSPWNSKKHALRVYINITFTYTYIPIAYVLHTHTYSAPSRSSERERESAIEKYAYYTLKYKHTSTYIAHHMSHCVWHTHAVGAAAACMFLKTKYGREYIQHSCRYCVTGYTYRRVHIILCLLCRDYVW